MPVIKGKCGTDCAACQFKEKFHCNGCPAQEGHIFWGDCSIYHCATGKGLPHCGKCPELPCSELTSFIENGHNPHRMANLLQWKEEEQETPAMHEIIIDGSRFDDIEGFYNEIDRLFTKDLPWKTGHNLDAFNDLLRGGFGVHEYGQPLRIKWMHYSKSKEDLGQLMMLKIMEIILDHDNSGHHCTLELYD